MKNRRYYLRLVNYFTELIEREGAARQDKNDNGEGKHYAVKASSVKRLTKLANDALTIDGADMNDREMTVAGFASILTKDDATRFLRTLPARDARLGGLWASSVVAFIKNDRVVQEKVNAFFAARWQGVTDEATDNAAPYWSYFIRFTFRYAEYCINKAHERGVEDAAHDARVEALCHILDVVSGVGLALRGRWLDNATQDNSALSRFFDEFGAVVENTGAPGYTTRRAPASFLSHIVAREHIHDAGKSYVSKLYEAFRNGVEEFARRYPYIEIIE